MKALKIGGFFLAGAIIQTVFYYAECLGLFMGYSGFIFIILTITCLGVLLGCTARNLAREKMKMSPFVLTMCYVAGTLAAMVALYFILVTKYPYHNPNGTGLGNLPNLRRGISLGILFYTIPSALVNAIIQVVLCVRSKIKKSNNKENENGTL